MITTCPRLRSMSDADLIIEAEASAHNLHGDSALMQAEHRHQVRQEIRRRGLSRSQIASLRTSSGRIPYLDTAGRGAS